MRSETMASEGPARARGSGLIGLSDRIEAMGGTLVVESPSQGGTSLLVELPIEVEEALTAQATSTKRSQPLS